MEQITTKLEAMCGQILDSVEKKPIRAIFVGVLVLWLIGAVIKYLKK